MTQPNGDFVPRTIDGVSLKDYIDEINDSQCAKCERCHMGLENRITAVEKLSEVAVKSIDTSTTLAREGMERRLDTMNEFRDTLKDQAGRFATRNEVEMKLESLGLDVRGLREDRAKIEGMASQKSVTWAYVLSVATLFISLAALVVVIVMK